MADAQWDELSDEQKAEALRLAHQEQPGAPTFRDPYSALPHTPGEGLRLGMSRAQHNIATAPVRAARTLAGPGATPGTERPAQYVSSALNLATAPFGTPEGAALSTALPLTRGMSALPRLATLGATGGATAGLTGGSPIEGTAEGVGTGVITGALQKTVDIARRGLNDVAAVTRGIVKDVPWFGSFLSRGAETGQIAPLVMLRDPNIGLRTLRTNFEAVKKEIVQAVGAETPLEIKGLTAGSTAESITKQFGETVRPDVLQQLVQEAQAQGLLFGETTTIDRAMGDLVRLKALGRRADAGAIGWAAREKARQVEGAIKDVIKTQGGPDLLAKYEDAVKQYGRGLGVLDALDNSDFLRLGPFGGHGDMASLQRFLNGNVGTFDRDLLPNFWKAATRNAEPGYADTRIGIPLPRIGILGGPVRSYESLPKVGVTLRVGTPSPAVRPIGPGATSATEQLPLSTSEYLRQRAPDETPLGQ